MLLAATNCPRMIPISQALSFSSSFSFSRYPTSSAQDDIRVLVLMMMMNMRGATLRVTITVGIILDAHNVFSHLAVLLDFF